MKETGRSGTEAYLKKAVAKAGGLTRKWVCPGRRNVPDQIVIWPRAAGFWKANRDSQAEIHMVETKAPGKGARGGQVREHKRLQALGVGVFVLDTPEKIDAYVQEHA